MGCSEDGTNEEYSLEIKRMREHTERHRCKEERRNTVKRGRCRRESGNLGKPSFLKVLRFSTDVVPS